MVALLRRCPAHDKTRRLACLELPGTAGSRGQAGTYNYIFYSPFLRYGLLPQYKLFYFSAHFWLPRYDNCGNTSCWNAKFFPKFPALHLFEDSFSHVLHLNITWAILLQIAVHLLSVIYEKWAVDRKEFKWRSKRRLLSPRMETSWNSFYAIWGKMRHWPQYRDIIWTSIDVSAEVLIWRKLSLSTTWKLTIWYQRLLKQQAFTCRVTLLEDKLANKAS